MKTKINWQKVDWARKLVDIAAEFGCHPDSAAKAKSRLGLTKPISQKGLDLKKRKISEKRAKAGQVSRAKSAGKCARCFNNFVIDSSTCDTCRSKMREYSKKYYFSKKLLEN